MVEDSYFNPLEAEEDKESYFDPLEAEAWIDFAYGADGLEPFRDDYEEAIGKIEPLVYAVTGEEEFTNTEVKMAREGLDELTGVEEDIGRTRELASALFSLSDSCLLIDRVRFSNVADARFKRQQEAVEIVHDNLEELMDIVIYEGTLKEE